MSTLFTNARVFTMDASQPRATALLVDAGRIVSVLDARPTGLSTGMTIVDLDGAAVFPGFHDCHVHLTDTGVLAGDHDFSDCRTVAEMLRRVQRLDDPLLYAGNYEEERIAEARPPTLQELDAISPDRPVLLTRIDGHSCVANAPALKLLDLEALEGFERDEAGKPTGKLVGQANNRAQHDVFRRLDDAARRRADERASRIALAAGVTTLHNVMAGDDPIEQLEAIVRWNAELPLHVIPKSCTTDVAKVKKLGMRVFGGDIFVDGSIGSRTAAMTRDYCDRPGETGRSYLTQAQLFELFDEAAEAGTSLGVHAIGDRAIDDAISAWEQVVDKRGRLAGLRPSIDHFEVTTSDQIERAAKCGLFLSMQPTFDYLWGGAHGMYERRLGEERARSMNRLKSGLLAGCTICGGSDSPVTKLDALLGIHAAVNHHASAERLSVEEALRAFTSDAAKLAFEEDERGRLAPGMAADFVVLEKSLHEVPPQAIKDIRIITTIVSGEIRYSRK